MDNNIEVTNNMRKITQKKYLLNSFIFGLILDIFFIFLFTVVFFKGDFDLLLIGLFFTTPLFVLLSAYVVLKNKNKSDSFIMRISILLFVLNYFGTTEVLHKLFDDNRHGDMDGLGYLMVTPFVIFVGAMIGIYLSRKINKVNFE